MSDLTDDRIEWMRTHAMSTNETEFQSVLLELQRHRAARSADAERVRSVVCDAACVEIGNHAGWTGVSDDVATVRLANRIAARAAKQLASAGLSLEERDDLDALLSSLNEQREAAIGFGQSATADMFRDQHAALLKLLSTVRP